MNVANLGVELQSESVFYSTVFNMLYLWSCDRNARVLDSVYSVLTEYSKI